MSDESEQGGSTQPDIVPSFKQETVILVAQEDQREAQEKGEAHLEVLPLEKFKAGKALKAGTKKFDFSITVAGAQNIESELTATLRPITDEDLDISNEEQEVTIQTKLSAAPDEHPRKCDCAHPGKGQDKPLPPEEESPTEEAPLKEAPAEEAKAEETPPEVESVEEVPPQNTLADEPKPEELPASQPTEAAYNEECGCEVCKCIRAYLISRPQEEFAEEASLESPTEAPVTETPPMEESPTEDVVAEEPPPPGEPESEDESKFFVAEDVSETEESPTEEAPLKEAPAEEAKAEETPPEVESVEEVPPQNTLADEPKPEELPASQPTEAAYNEECGCEVCKCIRAYIISRPQEEFAEEASLESPTEAPVTENPPMEESPTEDVVAEEPPPPGEPESEDESKFFVAEDVPETEDAHEPLPSVCPLGDETYAIMMGECCAQLEFQVSKTSDNRKEIKLSVWLPDCRNLCQQPEGKSVEIIKEVPAEDNKTEEAAEEQSEEIIAVITPPEETASEEVAGGEGEEEVKVCEGSCAVEGEREAEPNDEARQEEEVQIIEASEVAETVVEEAPHKELLSEETHAEEVTGEGVGEDGGEKDEVCEGPCNKEDLKEEEEEAASETVEAAEESVAEVAPGKVEAGCEGPCAGRNEQIEKTAAASETSEDFIDATECSTEEMDEAYQSPCEEDGDKQTHPEEVPVEEAPFEEMLVRETCDGDVLPKDSVERGEPTDEEVTCKASCNIDEGEVPAVTEDEIPEESEVGCKGVCNKGGAESEPEVPAAEEQQIFEKAKAENDLAEEVPLEEVHLEEASPEEVPGEEAPPEEPPQGGPPEEPSAEEIPLEESVEAPSESAPPEEPSAEEMPVEESVEAPSEEAPPEKITDETVPEEMPLTEPEAAAEGIVEGEIEAAQIPTEEASPEEVPGEEAPPEEPPQGGSPEEPSAEEIPLEESVEAPFEPAPPEEPSAEEIPVEESVEAPSEEAPPEKITDETVPEEMPLTEPEAAAEGIVEGEIETAQIPTEDGVEEVIPEETAGDSMTFEESPMKAVVQVPAAACKKESKQKAQCSANYSISIGEGCGATQVTIKRTPDMPKELHFDVKLPECIDICPSQFKPAIGTSGPRTEEMLHEKVEEGLVEETTPDEGPEEGVGRPAEDSTEAEIEDTFEEFPLREAEAQLVEEAPEEKAEATSSEHAVEDIEKASPADETDAAPAGKTVEETEKAVLVEDAIKETEETETGEEPEAPLGEEKVEKTDEGSPVEDTEDATPAEETTQPQAVSSDHPEGCICDMCKYKHVDLLGPGTEQKAEIVPLEDVVLEQSEDISEPEGGEAANNEEPPPEESDDTKGEGTEESTPEEPGEAASAQEAVEKTPPEELAEPAETSLEEEPVAEGETVQPPTAKHPKYCTCDLCKCKHADLLVSDTEKAIEPVAVEGAPAEEREPAEEIPEASPVEEGEAVEIPLAEEKVEVFEAPTGDETVEGAEEIPPPDEVEGVPPVEGVEEIPPPDEVEGVPLDEERVEEDQPTEERSEEPPPEEGVNDLPPSEEGTGEIAMEEFTKEMPVEEETPKKSKPCTSKECKCKRPDLAGDGAREEKVGLSDEAEAVVESIINIDIIGEVIAPREGEGELPGKGEFAAEERILPASTAQCTGPCTTGAAIHLTPSMIQRAVEGLAINMGEGCGHAELRVTRSSEESRILHMDLKFTECTCVCVESIKGGVCSYPEVIPNGELWRKLGIPEDCLPSGKTGTAEKSPQPCLPADFALANLRVKTRPCSTTPGIVEDISMSWAGGQQTLVDVTVTKVSKTITEMRVESWTPILPAYPGNLDYLEGDIKEMPFKPTMETGNKHAEVQTNLTLGTKLTSESIASGPIGDDTILEMGTADFDAHADEGAPSHSDDCTCKACQCKGAEKPHSLLEEPSMIDDPSLFMGPMKTASQQAIGSTKSNLMDPFTWSPEYLETMMQAVPWKEEFLPAKDVVILPMWDFDLDSKPQEVETQVVDTVDPLPSITSTEEITGAFKVPSLIAGDDVLEEEGVEVPNWPMLDEGADVKDYYLPMGPAISQLSTLTGILARKAPALVNIPIDQNTWGFPSAAAQRYSDARDSFFSATSEIIPFDLLPRVSSFIAQDEDAVSMVFNPGGPVTIRKEATVERPAAPPTQNVDIVGVPLQDVIKPRQEDEFSDILFSDYGIPEESPVVFVVRMDAENGETSIRMVRGTSSEKDNRCTLQYQDTVDIGMEGVKTIEHALQFRSRQVKGSRDECIDTEVVLNMPRDIDMKTAMAFQLDTSPEESLPVFNAGLGDQFEVPDSVPDPACLTNFNFHFEPKDQELVASQLFVVESCSSGIKTTLITTFKQADVLKTPKNGENCGIITHQIINDGLLSREESSRIGPDESPVAISTPLGSIGKALVKSSAKTKPLTLCKTPLINLNIKNIATMSASEMVYMASVDGEEKCDVSDLASPFVVRIPYGRTEPVPTCQVELTGLLGLTRRGVGFEEGKTAGDGVSKGEANVRLEVWRAGVKECETQLEVPTTSAGEQKVSICDTNAFNISVSFMPRGAILGDMQVDLPIAQPMSINICHFDISVDVIPPGSKLQEKLQQGKGECVVECPAHSWKKSLIEYNVVRDNEIIGEAIEEMETEDLPFIIQVPLDTENAKDIMRALIEGKIEAEVSCQIVLNDMLHSEANKCVPDLRSPFVFDIPFDEDTTAQIILRIRPLGEDYNMSYPQIKAVEDQGQDEAREVKFQAEITIPTTAKEAFPPPVQMFVPLIYDENEGPKPLVPVPEKIASIMNPKWIENLPQLVGGETAVGIPCATEIRDATDNDKELLEPPRATCGQCCSCAPCWCNESQAPTGQQVIEDNLVPDKEPGSEESKPPTAGPQVDIEEGMDHGASCTCVSCRCVSPALSAVEPSAPEPPASLESGVTAPESQATKENEEDCPCLTCLCPSSGALPHTAGLEDEIAEDKRTQVVITESLPQGTTVDITPLGKSVVTAPESQATKENEEDCPCLTCLCPSSGALPHTAGLEDEIAEDKRTQVVITEGLPQGTTVDITPLGKSLRANVEYSYPTNEGEVSKSKVLGPGISPMIIEIPVGSDDRLGTLVISTELRVPKPAEHPTVTVEYCTERPINRRTWIEPSHLTSSFKVLDNMQALYEKEIGPLKRELDKLETKLEQLNVYGGQGLLRGPRFDASHTCPHGRSFDINEDRFSIFPPLSTSRFSSGLRPSAQSRPDYQSSRQDRIPNVYLPREPVRGQNSVEMNLTSYDQYLETPPISTSNSKDDQLAPKFNKPESREKEGFVKTITKGKDGLVNTSIREIEEFVKTTVREKEELVKTAFREMDGFVKTVVKEKGEFLKSCGLCKGKEGRGRNKENTQKKRKVKDEYKIDFSTMIPVTSDIYPQPVFMSIPFHDEPTPDYSDFCSLPKSPITPQSRPRSSRGSDRPQTYPFTAQQASYYKDYDLLDDPVPAVDVYASIPVSPYLYGMPLSPCDRRQREEDLYRDVIRPQLYLGGGVIRPTQHGMVVHPNQIWSLYRERATNLSHSQPAPHSYRDTSKSQAASAPNPSDLQPEGRRPRNKTFYRDNSQTEEVRVSQNDHSEGAKGKRLSPLAEMYVTLSKPYSTKSIESVLSSSSQEESNQRPVTYPEPGVRYRPLNYDVPGRYPTANSRPTSRHNITTDYYFTPSGKVGELQPEKLWSEPTRAK